MQGHQKEIRTYLRDKAGIELGECAMGTSQEAEILSKQEENMAKVSNGFGGMVNYYHGASQYGLRQHPLLYDCFVQLYAETYASPPAVHDDANDWPNEYGAFDPRHMYMFVNRVGFRIPTIAAVVSPGANTVQRGTGVHLDCNPFHLFKGTRKTSDGKEEEAPLRFWQPIQAFVSLTDSPNENEGGFWCVPGFHRKCVSHFRKGKAHHGLKVK
eukprot:gene19093-22866_t